LAPLDQIHGGGWEATVAHADGIAIGAEAHVLDVGSGIGGPARYLAERFGCRVTGLDLTEAFYDVATMLTGRTGQDDHVTFRHGDALAMPFADAAFDVVWSQSAAMNIADRSTLYGEIHRVLKPGGTFTFSEMAAGSGGPVIFPVPWAREESLSFLLPPDEVRRLVEAAGFRITGWVDETGALLAWRDRMREVARTQPRPALGPHIVLGSDMGERAANAMRNLAEKRCTGLLVTAQRPA
jgi:SAM-dependent methyltransferase